jgi:hypothetical protein
MEALIAAARLASRAGALTTGAFLTASGRGCLHVTAIVTTQARVCQHGPTESGEPVSLMSLFEEFKRRNVIRMAGLYVVGAWLITQVAGTVLPMFGAPDWIGRSIVTLLAIGFVPTMLFS